MGLGTRGILNFGPCAEWGHPELSPVGTDDDAPRAGCLFTNPGDLSHTSKLIELTRFSAPLIRSRPWRFINPFTYLLTYQSAPGDFEHELIGSSRARACQSAYGSDTSFGKRQQ